jgi:hypothetical protein
MTHERFEALAEAYGGDVARWPAAEREDAALLMAQAPDFTSAVLARTAALDGVLDRWRPLPVSHALSEAVIAAAPAARGHAGLRGWFWRAGVGAALAGACAAGLVVGVKLSDAVQRQTEETISASLSINEDLSGLGDV